MQCSTCKQDNDRVVDSRLCSDGAAIRRRRECLSCGRRFTTYERAEVATRIVTKKDGRREPFSRDKVLRGLRTACQKRPISEDQLARIADRIEAEVFGDSDREVPSTEIGEKVIEELKALDKVAYVRFASVYREFTDVGEFVEALLPFLRGETLAKIPGGLNGEWRRSALKGAGGGGTGPLVEDPAKRPEAAPRPPADVPAPIGRREEILEAIAGRSGRPRGEIPEGLRAAASASAAEARRGPGILRKDARNGSHPGGP
jgi:transcriptional repressor NrdR